MSDFPRMFGSTSIKMSAPLSQDKTCRICGTVDTRNVNIFDPKQKSLLYKILTIFPITMYESDPLPKNICKKCVLNVSDFHEECQKLVKVQQKWVDNVRVNQPGHPYVTVLNIIEETHQQMLRKIKTIAPDFMYKNIRLHQREYTSEDDIPDTGMGLLVPCRSENVCNYQEAPPVPHINNFSFDFDITTVKTEYNAPNGVDCDYEQASSLNQRRSSIKEIQNKLQSNGCTLLVKTSPQFEPKPKPMPNKVRLTVDCKYCPERFPNPKFLAKHQLQHMTVSDRRIFDRKYLEKVVRRGRLLPVGEKKCIRCLNCWKLFPDNRTILEHWSNGECEFFCQICGLEFASNPKQLREHVPEAHGIAYRSSRRQTINIPDVRILNKPLVVPEIKQEKNPIPPPPPLVAAPPPPKKTPPSRKRKTGPGRVSCSICFCSFPNFQSKNSHMRKHKNEVVPKSSPPKKKRRKPTVVATAIPTIFEQAIKTEKESESETDEPYEVLMVLNTNDERIKHFESSSDTPRKSPLSSRINAKKMVDLQDPVVSSQQPEPSPSSSSSAKITKSFQLDSAMAKKISQTVKPKNPTASATTTDQDHMQYDKMYNCHPCGKKFSSKTDLFQHKRLCQSNNKFGCRFCLRAFVTSADLQMHIMLMHKGS